MGLLLRDDGVGELWLPERLVSWAGLGGGGRLTSCWMPKERYFPSWGGKGGTRFDSSGGSIWEKGSSASCAARKERLAGVKNL